MTNTIYFTNTIRDDESVSTSPGDRSQRDIHIGEEDGHLEIVEGSSSSVVVGVNPSYDSSQTFKSNLNEFEILESSNLKSYPFKELKTATRNFHHDCVLGEGSFGKVFKGWVDENKLTATKPGRGIAVAVKRNNTQGFQGHEEWLAQVKYLGQLYHPNVVKLFGYYFDDKEHVLVSEFLHRGSLDNHLFRRGSSSLLSWDLRMRVALEAAKGLAFLHRAEINVIHRNFTSSNILLDSNYNAKLSGFGLGKDGPTGDMSHVSTRIMGTYGYAAPEYVATGHLTAKSDVYGFGVVLLEMLTGRRAIDTRRPTEEHNLVDWAKPYLKSKSKVFLVDWAKPYLKSKSKVFLVMDRHLEGQYSPRIGQNAATLALKCLENNPKLRPDMVEVVTTLEQLQVR